MEDKYTESIPVELKNLLEIAGYTTKDALMNINETDIQEIETFAQNDLHNIIEKEQFEKYYGVYKNAPTKFKILPGHKKILKNLSVKLKIDMKQQKCSTEKNPNSNLISAPQNSNSKFPSREADRSEIDLHEESKTLKGDILKKIKSSLEDHAFEKSQRESITERMQQITVDVKLNRSNEMYGIATCIFCSKDIKIFYEKTKSSYSHRWLRGNFYRHIEGHLNAYKKNKTMPESGPAKKKVKTLLNFFPKSQGMSETDSTSESVSTSSQASSNEQPIKEQIVIHNNILLNENTEDAFDSLADSELDVDLSKSQLEIETQVKAGKKRQVRTDRGPEKLKRQMMKIPDNQKFITSYFPYLNEMEKILNENSELRKIIAESTLSNIQTNENTMVGGFLKVLADTAFANNFHKSKGNTYDDNLRKFCSYLYLIGGRMLYESLYSNLNGSIPSITTLRRQINKNSKCEEGHARVLELNDYLTKLNIPKIVWMCEDGTRINGRVQYSTSNNKNVGFVLPLNPDGFPNSDAFQVK